MSEPFLGQITMFGFTFAPRGWANCDGQLLPISQNSALFSLLGTTYGGDGRTTFGLPDFRGRVPVHTGTGAGLPPAQQGQRAGAMTHTLTTPQLPAHSHPATLNANSNEGNSSDPSGRYPAAAEDPVAPYSNAKGATMAGDAVTTGNMGGNQSFPIAQPYLVVRFCIATVGLFPSRN